jgi:deoxyribose-phosphate aldolase
MFNWFKKKEKKDITVDLEIPDVQDKMEECLWEIKEEYDLATEEVDLVVNLKRQNIDYMREQIIKRSKDV